jgi:hypothetical protein
MPSHLRINILLCVLTNQYWTGLKCVSFIVKPNCMKYRLSGIEYCCQARYKWEGIPALLEMFLTLPKKFSRGKHSSLFVRFVMIQLLLPPCLTPFNFWSTRDEGKNEEERNSIINYSKDIILYSCLISAKRILATHISFFVVIKPNYS